MFCPAVRPASHEPFRTSSGRLTSWPLMSNQLTLAAPNDKQRGGKGEVCPFPLSMQTCAALPLVSDLSTSPSVWG